MKLTIGSLVFVLATGWAASVGATTISFPSGSQEGDHGTYNGSPTYSEGGFVMSATGPGTYAPYADIFDVFSHLNSVDFPQSSTNWAGILYTWSGGDQLFGVYADTLVLKKADNSGFTFNGFSGGEMHFDRNNLDAASAIRVTGTKLDNTTVFQDFGLDNINDGVGGVNDFQTFNATGLLDVYKQLTFTGLPGAVYEPFANFQGVPYGRGRDFSIDNIQLDQAPQAPEVPEPASLFLMGTGLAVIGVKLRRRQRAKAK